ncbi:MAG: deiodinase-like protein, partial [Verrucomicrobiota bacterium]
FPGLKKLQERFGEEVDIVLVYIREAHPNEGAENWEEVKHKIPDPKSQLERSIWASKFVQDFNLPFRFLVDDIDDRVATRWAAWPVRAFLINRDGTIGYAGAQGPWSYRPYEGFVHGSGEQRKWDVLFNEESLEAYLEKRFENL